MYTSEFIEKVEALPFVGKVRKHPTVENVGVYNDDGVGILLVSESEYLIVDTDRTAFESLRVNQKDELMNLVWQYISTPVGEREPEKRYMYKLPSDFDVKNVLTFSSLSEKYFFSRIESEKYKGDTLMFQKYFTDKEVEMMPADVINVLKACVKEEAD